MHVVYRRMRQLAWLLAALALAPGCRSRPPAPLVLLVTVDTLRADYLGAYGSPKGLTPRLDRLAAESTVFEAAYATASFTLPSLSSLMTGRYPEEVGIAGNSTVLAGQAPTLAGWLAARGFRTGAVVSNYVLRPASGFGRGFARYDATFPQREAVRPVPERVGPDTTAAALRMVDELRASPGPTLLWVHYQDPHGPYAPPPEVRERQLARERTAPDAGRELPISATQSAFGAIPRYQYLEGHHDPAFYRAGYDGEVAQVDQAIGALLDGLAARGLLADATVVFAADHGESLGEDDYWFSHGELLSEPLVRVPLLVKVPGRPPARRAEVAALLDVFPTLARLQGIAPPPGLRGRDLLAPGAERQRSEVYMSTLRVASTPRAGLIARGYKYLVEAGSAGPAEQLFRLGDATRDLAAAEPEVLASLRADLEAARRGLQKAGAQEQALSPDDEEKLRALGYVAGR